MSRSIALGCWLICVGAVGCLPAWRASLPDPEGEITVAGLDTPVEVLRDRWGIPHIRAETDEAVVFGLGYCHAQDRLWQMELQRRIGAGRLSEVIGPSGLSTDRYLRTLGIRARAEEAAAALPREWRWLVDSYVDGVNAYLAGDPKLPPEFGLLGIEPEPFTAADGFTWIKIMALGLGADADTEAARAALLEGVDAALVDELLAPFPDEAYRATVVPPGGQAALGFPRAAPSAGVPGLLRRLIPIAEPGLGSNNWVVAGTHTTTGGPLLANDPHLDLTMPSVWYLAHLDGARLHVAGATFPGLPGMPIGHNESLAWGLTNVGPDVQDLVLERFHPDDPLQVAFRGGYEPVTVRDERILVKRRKPVELRVRETRHGPVMTEFYDGLGAEVALRWTALSGDDSTLVAFAELAQAATVQDGMHALRHYVAPAQNAVLADRDGHIGWVAAGRYPLRPDGDDGNLPVPGWDGEHEWLGWLPFEQWPQSYDPPRGWIATANARTVGPDYPHFLGDDFSPPYRARRIAERLEAEQPLSAPAMAAIQDDLVSLLAAELLPTLERAAAGHPDVAATLAGWDASMAADSAAAAVFQAWLQQLTGALVADELGELAGEAPRVRAALLHRCFVLEDCSLCDDVTTPDRVESCDDAAAMALERGLDTLHARLGDQPDRWRWGDLHRTVFHHPLGAIAPLRRLLDREVWIGGGPYTVAASFYSSREPFVSRFGVSYRQVLDVDDWDRSLWVHPTGQSGHPASPHYDDMVAVWSGRKLLPMPFSADAVEQAARERQLLLPGR